MLQHYDQFIPKSNQRNSTPQVFIVVNRFQRSGDLITKHYSMARGWFHYNNSNETMISFNLQKRDFSSFAIQGPRNRDPFLNYRAASPIEMKSCCHSDWKSVRPDSLLSAWPRDSRGIGRFVTARISRIERWPSTLFTSAACVGSRLILQPGR